jgi:hypothetical protein
MSRNQIVPSRVTPEFDLLCLVSGPRPNYVAAEALLQGGLDWQRVLRLAVFHGVTPQLVEAFRNLDCAGVPPNVNRSLSEYWYLQTSHSLFLASELRRVTEGLAQESIRFATFKGPSLAATLYGDFALRESNDIDIIVEKKQVAKAESILDSLGYKPAYGSQSFRDTFLAYQRQFAFVRQAPMLVIDLHWDFTRAHVPFPITPAEIWSGAERIEIGGHLVPTLGRNDLALFLAGHGAKEGWRSLGWVCDFAMFLEKYPDLDWASLLHRAAQKQCGRCILVGCKLAAHLFGTRVPEDLLRRAESRADCRSVVDRAIHRLRDESFAPKPERLLTDLDLCETRTQTVKAIAGLLFTRTVGDYSSMPLLRPLWRLYHVTRPLRIASKAMLAWIK